MRLIKEICVTTGLALALFQANVNAGEWTSLSTINNLRIIDGSYIYGNLINGDRILSCGGWAFRVGGDTPLFKELVSMLLSAQVTGSRVKLYDTGVCVNGDQTVINGVQLKRD